MLGDFLLETVSYGEADSLGQDRSFSPNQIFNKLTVRPGAGLGTHCENDRSREVVMWESSL